MCKDCGCQDALHHHHHHAPGLDHGHDQEHDHHHHHKGLSTGQVDLAGKILAANDHLAAHNRAWFNEHQQICFNLMSSPGSGKTLLLEKTLQWFKEHRPQQKIKILVGDQQTDRDAARLKQASYPEARIKQINTPEACHLDAAMIYRECESFIGPEKALVILENVGNLVCPAAFDLGQNFRVALLSVTEGEDKPIKYPTLFMQADLIVLTKLDLAAAVEWNLQDAYRFLRQVNPWAPILEVSSKTGDGLAAWIAFLQNENPASTTPPSP
ncbi:MAG: hydrogenase nickel incorporation protein HypB [Bacteriovoracaceae bacterium]|nr:hydrogenase nickel incorporation protein HypB [Bacteriovoracaceae bacterium]